MGATLYHKAGPDTTYFFGLSGISRKEGQALLGQVGLYKDFLPWLYTFSALSSGTNSEFLPEVRVDHDFNIKLGASKDFVWIIGGSYIKYFDVHKDYIVSTGLTYYGQGWNFTYRIFRNKSDPGNIISTSQLLSLGIGREGYQWTYLDFSFGKQAYLPSYLVNPVEISQYSNFVNFKHRRWLEKNYGIYGALNYLKLSDGYEKYGLTAGFFWDF